MTNLEAEALAWQEAVAAVNKALEKWVREQPETEVCSVAAAGVLEHMMNEMMAVERRRDEPSQVVVT